jgi:hypothetical protein
VSDRFETVAIAYSQPEVAALRSCLEGHGIWTVLMSQGHASVTIGLTLALGGIQVRVHSEDAEAARAILARIRQAPYRGRIYTDNRLIDLALTLMILIAFGVPPPARIPADFLLDGRTARRDN